MTRDARQAIVDLPLCARILHLAGPLILSTTGMLVMQFVDGLFLARHSTEAIAAVGSAGMAAYLVASVFLGATGYAGTLVAQYCGARMRDRVGPAVWQGLYVAAAAGAACAAIAPAGRAVFLHVGHEELVGRYEGTYFAVMCMGMFPALAASALSGFFTGRGDNRTLMFVQLAGVVANIPLDYAMIFGRWGCPRMGVAGAAIATVASQALIAAGLAALFLSRRHRAAYATWSGRRPDAAMVGRLLRFGVPSGMRFAVEIAAWMVFLGFVGRIGTVELASTTIAWRINGIAFFPIIGLSDAVRTVVGQAMGRRDPGEAARATWQGMLLSEAWMIAGAALFVLFPRQLYALFQGTGSPAADFAAISDMGVVLLRFVAVYCLLDALNILLAGVLQGAGDTRWPFAASALMHALFLACLVAADAQRLGLVAEWVIATVFVLCMALVWLGRFVGGEWRGMRVIEESAGPPACC